MADKLKIDRVLSSFVFVSLVGSALYLVVQLLTDPSNFDSGHTLSLVQCVLGIIIFFLPTILRHNWHIIFPPRILVIYTIFLYCAIYLGEVRSFYQKIPHFDTILHGFSGAALGILGLCVVAELNEANNTRLRMDPLFIAIFSFCFAITLGVFWEIYEYSVDGLFKTNMQRAMTLGGEAKIGRAALHDTMKDLIVDAVGAFLTSLFGFIHIRRHPRWIENFDIRSDRKKSP